MGQQQSSSSLFSSCSAAPAVEGCQAFIEKDTEFVTTDKAYSKDMKESAPLLNEQGRKYPKHIAELPMIDTKEMPDATITVILDKENPLQKVGVESVNFPRSHCLVSIIPGGLLEKWNRENPGSEVQPGDHIVDVNGVGGDPRLIKKEWTSQSKVHIQFISAEVIELNIEKPENSYLGIKSRPSTKVHQITSITKGGLVDEWNLKNSENTPIQVGDYIVEVNRMQGDSEAIRYEWLVSTRTHIIVMAPRYRRELPLNTDEAEEFDG